MFIKKTKKAEFIALLVTTTLKVDSQTIASAARMTK
jgi:hypothetical protein